MIEYNREEEDNSISFIQYIPNFLDKTYCDFLYKELENETYLRGANKDGKLISREQKWLHNNNNIFSKKWKKSFTRWTPQLYNENIKTLQNNILNIYKEKYKLPDNINIPTFNSSLINVYNNENDFISFHQDNISEFADNPTIFILSFGEKRNMILKRTLYNKLNPLSMIIDNEKEKLNISIELDNNSLLVMGGSSQKYYCHSIIKENIEKKKRYSITFREHI